jgi:oxygen-independent coproporphyrinogen-3 oxidase
MVCDDNMSSIYVHIPFCLVKCRYCGFNSQPSRAGDGTAEYCRALIKEISRRDPGPGKPETVYFGGGTPSLLTAGQLSEIQCQLSQRYGGFASDCEVTIEANPGTADREKLCALRNAGFNRLSLGAQSFNDSLLKTMGRAHQAAQIKRAVDDARGSGFDNLGLDLIYALPGQRFEMWREDLRRAVDLGPEHISLYSLTYEEGTDFFRAKEQGRIAPCDESLEAEMYLWAIEEMIQRGYEHYEVSNFALPGRRSRHNLNYWMAGDYSGYGAGAHSHRGSRRWSNLRDSERYVAAMKEGDDPTEMEEILSPEQQQFEALFLGMRMTEGIDVSSFRERWGQEPRRGREGLWARWQTEGLVEPGAEKMRFTRQGLMLSDLLLAELAP